jgi:hypothetical protein
MARPISRRTKWMIAALAFAIAGAATLFCRGGLADDAELMMLMPQLTRTPIHTVAVSFDQSNLRGYISKLQEIGRESDLSIQTRNTSPDPNDVFLQMWGKGILVSSVYRLENSPKNYSIFIYARSDESSRPTADVVFARITQDLASVPGIKLTVEK